MTGADPIDRLAESFGIERHYWDVSGREHHAPDDTVIALLAAMGIAAETESARRESLERVEAENRTRLLPPCYRLAESGPQTLPLPIGDTARAGDLAWRIDLESGESLSGELDFSQLPYCDDGSARRLFRPHDGLPPGRHRLWLSHLGRETATTLIIAPRTAYGFADAVAPGARRWGVMAPLYGLRSARNCGIGDYEDLARLAGTLAAEGADFIGINPVHALFPAEPEWASPYSPSNRLFLNTLHIAPDRVAEFAGNAAAATTLRDNEGLLAAARAGRLVDYGAVAAVLRPLFNALYDRFRQAADQERRQAFAEFRAERGARLQLQAVHDALQDHLRNRKGVRSHADWPQEYRDPRNAAVTHFSRENADLVEFHAYLQWLADQQLGSAQSRARAAGMAFGLYLDLAIGAVPGGAEIWSDREAYAQGVSLGAPPDRFAPAGQNWGLAPFNPRALAARGFEPFAALLAAVMRHAGIVRIDHVLGLARNFWIPENGLPGAYVRFPLDDMLAVAAIESHRARTVIVGEDLGNVPDGLRRRMRESAVLGCSVAFFEREGDGRFRPPEHYPREVVASVGTHDLPTLAGYWAGRDIDWREIAGSPPEVIAAERASRARDRALLAELLCPGEPAACDPAARNVPWSVVERLHCRLAQSPAALVALRLEDALGEVEQANLPGTIDEHPNWRRRLPCTIDDVMGNAGLARLAAILGRMRTRADPAG